MTAGLPTTGERTVPGAEHEQYWFARHEVVYRWAADHVRPGERWLDAGSGEGYGSALLADSGARVVGVELDPLAAAHARSRYPWCAHVRANLVALPLADDAFDALVSLQVVEHLWDASAYVRELARVGRPGARVLVSTPNRPVFSPGLRPGERPQNPFHVREFDADELARLLAHNGLDDVTVLGVQHGERLTRWEREHGSIVSAQVEAAVSGYWPHSLASIVDGVTADDFVIASPEDAHDLLSVASVR